MKRKIISLILTLAIGLAVLPGCTSSIAKELEECKDSKIQLENTLEEKDIRYQEELKKSEEKSQRIEELEAVILRDPSYDELMKFIIEDKTDEEEYFSYSYPDEYSYILYAQAFLENAKQQGIRGYLVAIRIANSQFWFFTGFETIDRGWIYFLPTIDQIANLEIGKRYCEINSFYECSSIDDRIEQIMVFEFS